MHLVLDVMPPDETLLTWLRKQLDTGVRTYEPLSAWIENDFEQMSAAIKKYPRDTLSSLRQELADKESNEAQKRKVMALRDDDVLSLIQDSYTGFLDSVLDILDSKMSYDQKHGRLDKLVEAYRDEAERNPACVFAVTIRAEAIPDLFYWRTFHTASCNTYKAAVEIYLLRATNGRLPAELPDGLPKDPFTGKNFAYKVTEEGFVLSHLARDRKRDVREYKFKIRQ